MKTIEEQLAWIRKTMEANEALTKMFGNEECDRVYWAGEKAHLEAIEITLASMLVLQKTTHEPTPPTSPPDP